MPFFIVDLQDSWHLHDKMVHLPPKTPGDNLVVSQHIGTICVKMGIFSEKQCWTFWNHQLFKCFTFQLSLGVLHQNSSLGVVNCPPRTMPPPNSKRGRTRSSDHTQPTHISKFMGCAYILWHVQQPCRCRKKKRLEKRSNKQKHLNPIQNNTCWGRDDFYVGSITL